MTEIIILIAIGALFLPQYGLYWRLRRRRWLHSRQAVDDALAHLHQFQHDGRQASVESLSNTLGTSTKHTLILVDRMAQLELVIVTGQGMRLTAEGHRWALQIIRAHRLFERYLADETSVPREKIHAHAHQLEHTVTEAQVDKMDADMGHPTFDPQGDPIPNAAGDMKEIESQKLVDWPAGKSAQIVHIEDEPPEVYAQIIAEELHPGMIITIMEMSPVRVVIGTPDAEHVLAPVVAANISVREAPTDRIEPADVPLTTLKHGEAGRVVGLSPACQGLTRRRFLDLGLTPGARIERVMQSAFSDPTAYRVRNTLIALRREQSDMVRIERATGAERAGSPAQSARTAGIERAGPPPAQHEQNEREIGA